MGVFHIPLRPKVPHQSFTTELDGNTYGFEFRWNSRAEAWFFHLFDVDGNLLVAGRRLVLRRSLIEGYRVSGTPPGMLVAVDTLQRDKDAGLEDLGSRIKLYYYDAAEFAATEEG